MVDVPRAAVGLAGRGDALGMALFDTGWLAIALALFRCGVFWFALALLAVVFAVLTLPYSVARGACDTQAVSMGQCVYYTYKLLHTSACRVEDSLACNMLACIMIHCD